MAVRCSARGFTENMHFKKGRKYPVVKLCRTKRVHCSGYHVTGSIPRVIWKAAQRIRDGKGKGLNQLRKQEIFEWLRVLEVEEQR